MLLTRFQHPNPLDLMFFAADEAARRMGLPGVQIYVQLDLGGVLDVPRFKRALNALYRVYPVAAARRETSVLTGRPRWRLDGGRPDLGRVVPIHNLNPATEDELRRQIEALLHRRLHSADLPPIRFHVFRGLSRGDFLVMRFPHALMDARGATFLLEDVDQLYEQAPDPQTLGSAGDEQRDDYGELLSKAPLRRRARLLLTGTTGSAGSAADGVKLAPEPASTCFGRLGYAVRSLTPAQTQQVQDNALGICGFGRFGDYLRACAIQALHTVMPRSLPAHALYTTLNLVNNRKRRQRSPVCRNLTSALPITIPAREVDDRRRVADLIQQQTAEHLASESTIRHLLALDLFMRVPTAFAAAAIQAGWTGRKVFAGLGLSRPPSLPLGLMGPFTRPMPTFCGVKLNNYYGFATARPRPGFAVDVNTTGDRINICSVHYESQIPAEIIAALLDKLVAGLLDAK